MKTSTNELEPVIGLIRVSTDKQETLRQRADLERVARAHRLKFFRIVELSDVSGRHVMADPEIQRMLDNLKSNQVAGIAISALDRLFRPDRFESFGILDVFRDHGKLIYSAKEGRLDPSTDAGFIMSLMSGAQAGMEWRELRRRTMQGKEEKRKAGIDPGGPQTRSRGVVFTRIRNASGKTIGGTWSHDGIDSERVRRAYEMLVFQDLSCEAIASEIGSGWTGKGIRGALTNPIWIGLKRYDSQCDGPEYFAKKPKDLTKKVKARRRVSRREEPLLVPVEIPKLVSEEMWRRAQEILGRRMMQYGKRKEKNTDRRRFLANSVARCSCGKSIYVRYGTKGHGRDTYYCTSRSKGGPGCGMPNIYREDLDAAILRLLISRVLTVEIIRQVTKPATPVIDQGQAQREAALAKLTKRRKNLLDMRENGECTREEFRERLKAIEQETRDLLDLAQPAPVGRQDPRRLARVVAGAFAGIAKLPFVDQRALLRRAVAEIIIEGHTIQTITFRGGFLATANSQLPSISRCSRRCRGRVWRSTRRQNRGSSAASGRRVERRARCDSTIPWSAGRGTRPWPVQESRIPAAHAVPLRHGSSHAPYNPESADPDGTEVRYPSCFPSCGV
jgi:DNA invertase Pin-like site-specific DNA recombinase